MTLLDSKLFHNEKLIVRPKRLVRDFGPSKFPQSFFGSSPISDHFKHFRDCVVPSILANPSVNLNVTSVKNILEQNKINLDYLPNRVWCVQCTLVPQCHRTYCSFYHSHQEKELGRIISILAAQNGSNSNGNTPIFSNNSMTLMPTPDTIIDCDNLKDTFEDIIRKNQNAERSKHTLLIQGLPRSITPLKIQESFEVFGEIDNVIVSPDQLCYVRMKRAQDAKKIVHLFKNNNAGIGIVFAPYTNDAVVDTPKHTLHDIKSPIGVVVDNTTLSIAAMTEEQKLAMMKEMQQQSQSKNNNNNNNNNNSMNHKNNNNNNNSSNNNSNNNSNTMNNHMNNIISNNNNNRNTNGMMHYRNNSYNGMNMPPQMPLHYDVSSHTQISS